MRVVELYYTVQDLCTLLRYSKTWLIKRLRAGDFGDGVLDVAGDYRIPASGVNAFLSRYQFNGQPAGGIAARNKGELLRKMRRGSQKASILQALNIRSCHPSQFLRPIAA